MVRIQIKDCGYSSLADTAQRLRYIYMEWFVTKQSVWIKKLQELCNWRNLKS
jgi:hypothetical protein